MDRPYRDLSKRLRSPDLRLGDVRTSVPRGFSPFEHHIEDPERVVFVYARRGDFVLDLEDASRSRIWAPQGTAVGFERGRAQRWRAASKPGDAVELLVSTIPRWMGVLQRLEDGLIVVPPDAEPFASVIRQSVDLHIFEYQNSPAGGDDAVIRRCAEIVLIQFVRYARAGITTQSRAPAGLVHDEHLLRAWSAFFADPKRRWTVQALAKAAGLGRTSFAERFHRVFGTPPLQTLTTLRLEQAETMLRQSQAPLIEIAFAVGYSSETAFVRAFHRAYGVPPGRFRQQNRSRLTASERPEPMDETIQD